MAKVKWNKEKLIKAAYSKGIPLYKLLSRVYTKQLESTPQIKTVQQVSKRLGVPAADLIIVEE